MDPNNTHIIAQEGDGIEEQQAGRKEGRGKWEWWMSTAGGMGEGSQDSETSDQLHADLKRRPKKKCLGGGGWRGEKKRGAQVRYIWEETGDKTRDSSQWVMLTSPEGTRLESFYSWWLHRELLMFRKCKEHSGAKFRLRRMEEFSSTV